MREATPTRATPDPAELARLLSRIALRDETAFDQLYRLVSPRFHALALYLTRRPDQAEEAMQDLFTTVWFRAETYRPEAGPVLPWMVTILRNRVIGMRRGKALAVVPLEEADMVVSDALSPYDTAALSEAGRRIAAQMEALSPNIRRSVQLAFFHGADYREIAQHMGVPTNTAKSWVRRGLLRLQRGLEAHQAPAIRPDAA
jgi:RNA polymerase sigma-70 factor (ECF subfamily)